MTAAAYAPSGGERMSIAFIVTAAGLIISVMYIVLWMGGYYYTGEDVPETRAVRTPYELNQNHKKENPRTDCHR